MAKSKSPKRATPSETVRQVLKDGGLKLEKLEGRTGYSVALGDELYAGATAHVLEEQGQFVFYVEYREKAPKKNHPQVAEFITRANYGILIGNFEMNHDDGSVRYKSSVDYEGTVLTYELVRNAVLAARNGNEEYGSALVEVMKGSKSAKKAIAEVEAE
jgi:hypothetical protein